MFEKFTRFWFTTTVPDTEDRDLLQKADRFILLSSHHLLCFMEPHC